LLDYAHRFESLNADKLWRNPPEETDNLEDKGQEDFIIFPSSIMTACISQRVVQHPARPKEVLPLPVSRLIYNASSASRAALPWSYHSGEKYECMFMDLGC